MNPSINCPLADDDESQRDEPKKSELLRRVIDFIFGFENRRGEVLDYWIAHADGFTFSAQEFYLAIESQMAEGRSPAWRSRGRNSPLVGCCLNRGCISA